MARPPQVDFQTDPTHCGNFLRVLTACPPAPPPQISGCSGEPLPGKCSAKAFHRVRHGLRRHPDRPRELQRLRQHLRRRLRVPGRHLHVPEHLVRRHLRRHTATAMCHRILGRSRPGLHGGLRAEGHVPGGRHVREQQLRQAGYAFRCITISSAVVPPPEVTNRRSSYPGRRPGEGSERAATPDAGRRRHRRIGNGGPFAGCAGEGATQTEGASVGPRVLPPGRRRYVHFRRVVGYSTPAVALAALPGNATAISASLEQRNGSGHRVGAAGYSTFAAAWTLMVVPGGRPRSRALSAKASSARLRERASPLAHRRRVWRADRTDGGLPDSPALQRQDDRPVNRTSR